MRHGSFKDRLNQEYTVFHTVHSVVTLKKKQVDFSLRILYIYTYCSFYLIFNRVSCFERYIIARHDMIWYDMI